MWTIFLLRIRARGPAYDPKPARSFVFRAGLSTCSRETGRWFSVHFLKVLAFCRLLLVDKLIPRQFKPGLVLAINPWQGSRVTTTHKINA